MALIFEGFTCVRRCSVVAALALALALLAAVGAGTARAADAEGMGAAPALSLALTPAAVDVAASGAYADGRALGAPSAAALLATLGLEPGEGAAGAAAWSTGPLAEQRRDFVVAFTAALPIGTVVCPWAGTTTMVATLRPGAPWPPDPLDEAKWETLASRTTRTLPVGFTTRALRLTHRYSNQAWITDRVASAMPPLLLLRERAYSPLDFAPGGRGQAEWSRGVGALAGQDTLALWWPRALPLAGMVVAPTGNGTAPTALHGLYLGADTEGHPTAPETIWQRVPAGDGAGGAGGADGAGGAASEARLEVFPAALSARGLRLVCTVDAGWRRGMWCQPLVALGADPVPPGFLPTAPVTVDFAMPMDGFAAVRLRDAEGRELRRLGAELRLPAGDAALPWDLKDDAGNYVAPGVYSWRAVARPPLKLTYQATVYNAGSPPWNAPVQGGGAWMADHSPPVAVAAVGDRVLMSALGAEFGNALIATDPDGRKVWTRHEGAQRLVADDRYVYLVDNDGIVRIDPTTFRQENLLALHYSLELPGPRSDYLVARTMSAAISGDRMYVSINGNEAPWIASSVKAGHVDLRASFPPPDGMKVHETEYTSEERILGALQIIQSSQQAYFGDTVTKGPLANSLVLRLRQAVPVGSIMLPAGVTAYALREGQTLPDAFNPRTDVGGDPNALLGDGLADDLGLGLADLDTRFDPAVWQRLDVPEKGYGLARAATGLRTRAIVFTAPTLKRLDYAMILDRRYHNATVDATIVPLEGTVDATGRWTQARPADQPISSGNPPTCAIVWDAPRPIRGFAITDPFPWSTVAVDVWTGDATATIDRAAIADDANWQEVHRHAQQRNHVKMNWHTNRVITGDLGRVRELRAMRVRILEPSRAADNRHTIARGGFSHFVAFEPLGDDVALPDSYANRLTEIQLPGDGEGAASATIKRHLRIPSAGPIAASPDGTLYVISGGAVCRVEDLDADPVALHQVVPASALSSPIAMACDKRGMLYVLQLGTKCIDVFNPVFGAKLRTIGTPGGVHPGPYDPTRFSTPVAMTIDPYDKLWVVEQDFQPKRITRWSLNGVLEKELYGPTHYGGGGMIDPRDHAVVNYHGMKFRIDWQTYDWKLEAILYRPGESPMNTFIPGRVIYVEEHRYLASDVEWTGFGDTGAVAAVNVEREGVAIPIAAAGVLGRWSAYLRDKSLQAAWKTYDPNTTAFVWSDLDGDGTVQLPEVQVRAGLNFSSATFIGEDLSFNFTGVRLPLQTLRADGLPLYDLAAAVPVAAGARWTGPDGAAFVMGHYLLDPAGVRRWSYPDDYMSVQMSARAPGGFANRPPGVLVGGLRPVGRFTVGAEEYYTVLGNHGDWYAFTRDGMLAACIFGGPAGYGERYFATPDYRPGITDLSDLRTTVEDFYGNIVTAEDGHVYAIAGKNHLSMIRVDGLEDLQRLAGTITVTADDLARVKDWNRDRQRVLAALEVPKTLSVAGRLAPPVIDGDITVDWVDQPQTLVREIFDVTGKSAGRWTFALAWDATNLYVAAAAHDETPMRNSAADWRMLHQHGDALDLALGLDPAADPERVDPAAGDRRILLSVDPAGKPRALMMRYVAPDAPPDSAYTYTSPIAATPVQELRLLPEARLAIGRADRTWTLEAAIPWAALGVAAPAPDSRLRGDVGFLASDDGGTSTVERFYWANRRHVVMGDLPAESRINPGFWGELRLSPISDAIKDLDLNDLGNGSATDALLLP